MKWIKLYEEFQMGDLNFMSPEEIQNLFFEECEKETPDLNLIRVIVENGLVDVNSKDKWRGDSPLFWAVWKNNRTLAKLLISAGADVNAKNNGDMSPLYVAVLRDNIVLAEYLISTGADVNAKDNVGDSPLHLAVSRNNIVLAEYLISAGADVNSENFWGRSPLALAVSRGNEEMQALLKQHGAVE